MDLNSNPFSPHYALRMAEYLTALAQPAPGLPLERMIVEDVGTPGRYRTEAATDDRPNWFAGEYGRFTIIMVGGCSTFTHADRTISAYQGGVIPVVVNPVQTYFQLIANFLITQLAGEGMPHTEKLILVGQSLGGGVCEHLANYFRGVYAPENMALVTFGAPSPGSTEFNQANRFTRRARWMCSDDPVCLLPQAAGALAQFLLAYNVQTVRRFGYFVQTEGGRQIKPDSTVEHAVLPSDARINTPGALAGWLLAIDGSSSSGHHIASYRSRLAEYVLRHPLAADDPVDGGPAGDPVENTRHHYTRQQAELAVDLNIRAERNNEVNVIVPANRLFRAVRNGRIWMITTNDHTIAVTTHRRAAQRLARSLNESFQRLQVQPLVNSDEFAAQVQDYLAEAVREGGNFTPPMSDQLPEP